MVKRKDLVKCPSCKGKGCVDVEITCNECNGEGHLDWIENVVGKKPDNRLSTFVNTTLADSSFTTVEDLVDGIIQEHNLRIIELEEKINKLEELVERIRNGNKI